MEDVILSASLCLPEYIPPIVILGAFPSVILSAFPSVILSAAKDLFSPPGGLGVKRSFVAGAPQDDGKRSENPQKK